MSNTCWITEKENQDVKLERRSGRIAASSVEGDTLARLSAIQLNSPINKKSKRILRNNESKSFENVMRKELSPINNSHSLNQLSRYNTIKV